MGVRGGKPPFSTGVVRVSVSIQRNWFITCPYLLKSAPFCLALAPQSWVLCWKVLFCLSLCWKVIFCLFCFVEKCFSVFRFVEKCFSVFYFVEKCFSVFCFVENCLLLCWKVLFCLSLCWKVLFCLSLCWKVLFCLFSSGVVALLFFSFSRCIPIAVETVPHVLFFPSVCCAVCTGLALISKIISWTFCCQRRCPAEQYLSNNNCSS